MKKFYDLNCVILSSLGIDSFQVKFMEKYFKDDIKLSLLISTYFLRTI